MGEPALDTVIKFEPKTWAISRTGSSVTARFRGRLTHSEGSRSAREFVNAVRGDQVQVVFDIREMEGYESGARKEWARALKPIAKNLDEIRIRGGNALVRMGGSVLGAMIGVPVKFDD